MLTYLIFAGRCCRRCQELYTHTLCELLVQIVAKIAFSISWISHALSALLGDGEILSRSPSNHHTLAVGRQRPLSWPPLPWVSQTSVADFCFKPLCRGPQGVGEFVAGSVAVSLSDSITNSLSQKRRQNPGRAHSLDKGTRLTSTLHGHILHMY